MVAASFADRAKWMHANGSKRIGLIGGSFDPIHLGHLIIARDAAEKLGLSEVVFIPAHTPPHKLDRERAASEHRLEMTRLATSGEPRYSVSDVEIARGGVSYTFDTVSAFIESRPGAEITLIVGGDTLVDLHTWYRIEDLLRLCDVATFARPGDSDLETMREKMGLNSEARDRLLANVFDARLLDISSTEIRDRVAEGLSISYLVPPEVEAYIFEHGLYQKKDLNHE